MGPLFPQHTVAARHRLLIIGGCVTVPLLLGLAAWPTTRQAPAPVPLAVYLEPAETPASLRLHVDPHVLDAAPLTVVQRVDHLQATVARVRPPSIWLNEAAVGAIPQPWLREQWRQGTVIVGINSTRRSLASALGLTLDGAPDAPAAGPARSPAPRGPRVAEEAALDWKPANRATVVVYWAVRDRAGSANTTYDPQQPEGLFAIVREAIRATQGRPEN